MSGNSGEQLLKILLKVVWFIILLIPSLVKMLYNGVVFIVNKFRKTEGVSMNENNADNSIIH